MDLFPVSVFVIILFIATLFVVVFIQKVPKPSKYFVSRWSKEEHIEMTYSYVGLEGNGDDYDQMAKQIDNKLYFAGEVRDHTHW